MACAPSGALAYPASSLSHSIILPLALFALWRTAVTVFLLATIIADFASRGADGLQNFTNWSYIGLGLTFTCLSVASLVAWRRRAAGGDAEEGEGEDAVAEPGSAVASALAALYHVFGISAPFVTIVYWGLLYNSETVVDAQNVFRHAVNTVVVAMDLALSRIVFRFSYLFFYIGFLLAYLVFIWIRFAFVKSMPYGFLDVKDSDGLSRSVGRVVGVYLGTIAFSVFLGTVIIGLTKLKTCCGGDRSRRLPTASEAVASEAAPDYAESDSSLTEIKIS